jgi:GTPase SAR1 family protein
MNINIAILGAVSSGKSTLMNSLFVEQYSDSKIKRTTMLPQVYIETPNSTTRKNIIESNRKINQNLANKTLSQKDIVEVKYAVPKVHDLVKLHPETTLTVYDMPGLNDSRTKELYFSYIKDNFHKFDIIIFMVDIMSSMNTSDEIDILKLILNGIKINQKYGIKNELLIIVNKCDEMTDKLVMDEEYEELFDQVKTITKMCVEEYEDINYQVIPMSCEDSYIYRMFNKNPNVELNMKYINKFGYNEFGKSKWNVLSNEVKHAKIKDMLKESDYDVRMQLSGFTNFKNVLQLMLNGEGQMKFIQNHIMYDFVQQTQLYGSPTQCGPTASIIIGIKTYYHYKIKLQKVAKIFNYSIDSEYKHFYMQFNDFVHNYFSTTVSHYIDILPKNNEELVLYKEIQSVFKLIKQLFFECNCVDVLKTITNSINEYNKNKCIDMHIFNDKIKIIDELIDNDYTEWKKLLIDSFNDSESDLKWKTVDELFAIIKSVETSYDLDRENIIDILFTLIYRSYDINKNVKQLMFIKTYWNNIQIKTTNEYYMKIYCLQNVVNIMNLTQQSKDVFSRVITGVISLNDDTECYNFALEEHLMKYIKRIHPKDICTTDECIRYINGDDNSEIDTDESDSINSLDSINYDDYNK